MRRLIAGLAGLTLAFGTAIAKGETTSVLGNVSSWQDAGIDVTTGQMFYVSASGNIQFGSNPISNTDPNGLGPDKDGSQRDPNAILPDATFLSLIAKVGGTGQVGTGTPVSEDYAGRGAGLVGISYCRAVSTSGRLYFAYNDATVFYDNTGAFTANYGIVSSPVSLSVDGTIDHWQDTGIDIVAGQVLCINASGNIQFGSNPISTTDPDGLGPDKDGSQRDSQAILPDAVQFSLIAKIGGTELAGTGTPVTADYPGMGAGFVGSSYCRVVSTSGRLYLAYNDAMEFGDNTGSFAVSVGVVPEPTTIVLLVIGAIGLLGFAWRRRNRAG